jgi:16S rRNA G966 N2-methylase RsmD
MKIQQRLTDEKTNFNMKDVMTGKINIELISDDEVIDVMFNYLRKNGFPYYEKHNPQKTMRELTIFKSNKILEKNNILDQTMHGCGCAAYYFPHMWSVRCNNHLSPMDVFNDDDKLKIVLKKVWHWCIKHENKTVSMNRIRQGLKIYGGAYGVSNFKPTVAKYIYDIYGGDKVWDMCAGWGGRLLGALSSKKIKIYHATEPSTKTYGGLTDMAYDFGFVGKNVIVEKLSCEDYIPGYNFDLCFTSPPYFDTEKYSNEMTQSYIKYPDYKTWLNDFLYMTIDNCHMALKDDGILALNIANTPQYTTIVKDTKDIFDAIGFKIIKEYKMVLSSIAGKGIKLEPIFICKKQGA